MNALIFKISATSDLKTGDIFRPLKWSGMTAAGKDYVVCESRLVRDWDSRSGTIFHALPLQMFMSLRQVYWPAQNKASLSFRETAGLVAVRGNILGEKKIHIPATGSFVTRSGRKRRNGRRSTKNGLVISVRLTPPSSYDPLCLKVHTDTYNTLGYYPRREDCPHYKITSNDVQGLAL